MSQVSTGIVVEDLGCQLPERDRTARPLILRGLISMNRFRVPSAQGTGPVPPRGGKQVIVRHRFGKAEDQHTPARVLLLVNCIDLEGNAGPPDKS